MMPKYTSLAFPFLLISHRYQARQSAGASLRLLLAYSLQEIAKTLCSLGIWPSSCSRYSKAEGQMKVLFVA